MTAPRRVRARVAGRVQGVGFRFFCRGAAERCGILGWVRNLPSGEVELEAQGAPGDLDRFFEELRKGFPGARVDGLKSVELPPEEGGREFEIRF